jgi:hypothetical protein
VRVADVLAEYYGRESSFGLDDEAAALATELRGIRRDWADKPCLTWSAAKLLLESKTAERLRVMAERSEREARADARRAAPPEQPVPASSGHRWPREYW